MRSGQCGRELLLIFFQKVENERDPGYVVADKTMQQTRPEAL